MTDNPISTAWSWYRDHGPSPWETAALLGLGAYGAGRLAWGPVVEAFRSLGRPLASKYNASDTDWDASIDELKDDESYRKWIPAGFGTLAGLTALGMFYNPKERYNGVTSWSGATPGARRFSLHAITDLFKNASFDGPYSQSMQNGSYMGQFDWNQPININAAAGLFNNDPFLKDDPYARHMGTAIINNAGIQQHTNRPTLGGIFDSAVDKIENKLSFGGLVNVGVKTAVANGLARMFTGALDTMVGLPQSMQKKLVDAGTWAGAVTAILE